MKTNERLRIGLVLDDSLDTPDGVQQYVLTVGRWLSGQGHEVHYIVGETQRDDLPHIHSMTRNWKVRFNGNSLSIPLPASRDRLQALLKAYDFDIIHIQTPYSPFLAGRLIQRLSASTALIGSFHVLPYDRWVRLANHLLAVLNRRTGQRFDCILANSEPTGAFAGHVYGYRAQQMPNPFSLVSFQPKQPSKNKATTIVFLGRLVSRKGAKKLLQAVVYIREHHLTNAEFQVLIGGKGPLRGELENFVTSHDLTDIVTFQGFVDEAHKTAFLSEADLAVFPSISGESFGISLLEGMAAARGVVLAGDNPGYRSVMAPLNQEQLLNPLDTESFAQTLVHWLEDASARYQAAEAQKAYVKQFDIEVVGQKLLRIYSEALHQRRNMR